MSWASFLNAVLFSSLGVALTRGMSTFNACINFTATDLNSAVPENSAYRCGKRVVQVAQNEEVARWACVVSWIDQVGVATKALSDFHHRSKTESVLLTECIRLPLHKCERHGSTDGGSCQAIICTR